jgi:hypothetical protein
MSGGQGGQGGNMSGGQGSMGGKGNSSSSSSSSSTRIGPLVQKYDPNNSTTKIFKGGAKNGDSDSLCQNRTMYVAITNMNGQAITS